jgi:ABC-type multidrug transport system fused ATPase/permease subunit
MAPSKSVKTIILQMFKTNIFIACVLALIDSCLGFAGPIIMKYILQYVNTPNQTDRQQRVAYALAGIWIGLYFIKIFVSQYCDNVCFETGMCIEVTLMSELYRKIARVSYVYKKYIGLGDFYGYLMVDISVITSMASQFSNLVSAPVTLILSVIFVCVEIGAYGLLLLLVICIAIIIQLSVDFQRASIFA